MQTNFSSVQLADAAMATSEAVIRKCVHCGFCTATCPTYVLLGDELDSPRGRIYLIKDMLENDRLPSAEVVKHVDRCLSCLSCMTTCPSGVNYMHLVDHARVYIQEHYRRSWHDRAFRALLAFVLPHPARFRFALRLAKIGRPLAPIFARSKSLKPIAAMLALAPRTIPRRTDPPVSAAATATKGRIVLLQGCAEPVLRPAFQDAAIRLLSRSGYQVIRATGEGCCGALVHHMGLQEVTLEAVRRNVDAWTREIEKGGLEAILVTASGCGTMIKDYGFLLRSDPAYAQKAERVSALVSDISELLARIKLPPGDGRGLSVAYHPACSLQHGQKVTEAPKQLLSAGYLVKLPAEAHLCCGSAGTYNILQSEIADKLGDRKVANIVKCEADVIATGNIGCAMQIAQRTSVPVVHTVELLDWATGGPAPQSLQHLD